MGEKPIGWVFKCKSCGKAHLIEKLNPYEGDCLPYPFRDILCPIKNESRTYSVRDFTLVDGKAECKRVSFERGDK